MDKYFDSNQLIVPPVKLSVYGFRSFAVAGRIRVSLLIVVNCR